MGVNAVKTDAAKQRSGGFVMDQHRPRQAQDKSTKARLAVVL
jgi:hypothetical protein